MSSIPVSVIIPTYNREVLLRVAIESVCAQTFRDLELIIVDDGSDDGTRDLVECMDDKRIVYVYQDQKGPACARNVGLDLAKGCYIAFLDSDDRWHQDKLRRQTAFMDDHPECMVSHTEEVWYRRGIHLNPKQKHKKRAGDVFEQSLELCAVSMSTVMLRRELFDEVGVFDEALPVCEDYEFWLRVSSTYKFGLLDEKLTIKDGGRPDQLTQQYKFLDQYRIRALVNLLNKNDLTDKQIQAVLKVLKKKTNVYYAGCRKHGRVEEAEKILALTQGYVDV